MITSHINNFTMALPAVFEAYLLLSMATVAVATVGKGGCSIDSSIHLQLNGAHSAWWIGLEKDSKTYRVWDPPATVMSVLMETEPALQNPFYGTNLKRILQN